MPIFSTKERLTNLTKPRFSVFSGEHFVSFWGGVYKWSFFCCFFVFQVRADDGFGSENLAGKVIWKVEI